MPNVPSTPTSVPAISLSHLALLVPSVDHAAAVLRSYGFEPAAAEVWEGEGTKEIYVGLPAANALLLMEPAKPGAYERALKKRGPGLHHFAVDVPALEPFLTSIAGSGWLMHLNSVRTLQAHRTVYLARPGFPGLIEVQEKEPRADANFVTAVRHPLAYELHKLLAPVGLERLFQPSPGEASLEFNGGQGGGLAIPLSSLCGPGFVLPSSS